MDHAVRTQPSDGVVAVAQESEVSSPKSRPLSSAAIASSPDQRRHFPEIVLPSSATVSATTRESQEGAPRNNLPPGIRTDDVPKLPPLFFGVMARFVVSDDGEIVGSMPCAS